MTAKNRANLTTDINVNVNDNATEDVTPADVRQRLLDLMDSCFNLLVDGPTDIVNAISGRMLGRISASTGAVEQLTPAQVRTFIGHPNAATDDAIARFDGTGGDIQNSAVYALDGGHLVNGKTAPNHEDAGCELRSTGIVAATVSANAPLWLNRQTSDGTIVLFYQANVLEGTINVTGTTVALVGAALCHWSQLADNSRPTNLLRGTVMEMIDDVCTWPGERPSHLPRCKISDRAASRATYGLFAGWDSGEPRGVEEEVERTESYRTKLGLRRTRRVRRREIVRWEERNPTNDMLIMVSGDGVVRMERGAKVKLGDLLESAGDGCARVQKDDVLRASTIGRAAGTKVIETYDDGSYLLPWTGR